MSNYSIISHSLFDASEMLTCSRHNICHFSLTYSEFVNSRSLSNKRLNCLVSLMELDNIFMEKQDNFQMKLIKNDIEIMVRIRSHFKALHTSRLLAIFLRKLLHKYEFWVTRERFLCIVISLSPEYVRHVTDDPLFMKCEVLEVSFHMESLF